MAEIGDLGGNRFRVTVSGRSRVVYAVRQGADVWVFAEGRTFVISERGEVGRRDDDEVALSSPMPASVVSIKVSPGDRVRVGDTLVVLEAMKMELPITSPRDGVVKELRCAIGELIQPGVPLVEFE